MELHIKRGSLSTEIDGALTIGEFSNLAKIAQMAKVPEDAVITGMNFQFTEVRTRVDFYWAVDI